jgi:hypothetical protein
MNRLFLYFFLLLPYFSFAQNFPTKAQLPKWIITEYSPFGGTMSIDTFTVSEDTILCNELYQVVRKNGSIDSYYKTDGQKMWFYSTYWFSNGCPSGKLLLYDFSLSLGDTLDAGCLYIYDSLVYFTSTGILREKRCYTGSGLGHGGYHHVGARSVPGIGSLSHPFYYYEYCSSWPHEIQWTLNYFDSSGVRVYDYQDYQPLGKIVSSLNAASPDIPYIKIYPNPAQSEISIEINKEGAYEISITDPLGSLQKNITDIETFNSVKISMPHKPGLYFLSVKKDKQLLKTYKVILE